MSKTTGTLVLGVLGLLLSVPTIVRAHTGTLTSGSLLIAAWILAVAGGAAVLVALVALGVRLGSEKTPS